MARGLPMCPWLSEGYRNRAGGGGGLPAALLHRSILLSSQEENIPIQVVGGLFPSIPLFSIPSAFSPSPPFLFLFFPGGTGTSGCALIGARNVADLSAMSWKRLQYRCVSSTCQLDLSARLCQNQSMIAFLTGSQVKTFEELIPLASSATGFFTGDGVVCALGHWWIRCGKLCPLSWDVLTRQIDGGAD